MRIRGLGPQSQRAHIRAVNDFAGVLEHSPDTTATEELRAHQLHMTDTGVTPSVYIARISALRFFFSMTYGREGMKRYMLFRTQPRKLPLFPAPRKFPRFGRVRLGRGSNTVPRSAFPTVRV